MDLRKGFYAQVFENNRKWIADKLAVDSQYFERLAQGQNPEILFIGCSDSRLTAEELMGAEPGQVFVHRNIANIVGATDLSALSVIEYGIAYLNVKHVVVCGHYECGGVRAAMQAKDFGGLSKQRPTVHGWVFDIREGRLVDLRIDFARKLSGIRELYDLGHSGGEPEPSQ